jgi:hypothetical protein
MPAWLPAAGLSVAAAIAVFLVVRTPAETARPAGIPETGVASIAVGPGDQTPGRLDPAARDALGLGVGDAVHRIVLADFESWADTAVLRFTGDARPDLVAGGHTGRMALATPAGDGSVEIGVPPAHRLTVAGISVELRSADPGTVVTLIAGFEDGHEVELAPAGVATGRGEWKRLLFSVPSATRGAGGGVRWLRFRVTGREPAKLDTMELWSTATEARR